MSLDHAFFYKSVNGDRVYDDTSFEHWLKKFFTSGVFLNDLQVTANEDMTVTVGAGYTNIDGKVKIFTSETPLIIETAGASYPRIDSIVLERNDTERDILLKVVKGGYSSEPVAHTPVRQDGVYQLVIAQILVNAGAVKVSQADITDTRSNTELCGIVAGAVEQIDFSQIQAQFDSYLVQYKKQLEEEHAEHNADMDAYLEQMETNLDQMEADFAAWFEGVKNQLDEDAAGHLQNQIDDINARLEYAGGSMVEITVESNDEEYNVVGLELNLEIDGKTYTKTIPSEKVVVFTGVLEVGTAKITCVDEAQEFNAETSIEIPYYGAYECLMKGGSYEKWIEAGGLNPSSYESLETLLEDETAIRTLMTKKAAVDTLAEFKGGDLATIINHPYVAKWVNYREYAYSTLSAVGEIKTIMDASGMYGMYITVESDGTWQPKGLVPVMTSNTAPYGEAFASTVYGSGYEAFHAFDFNETHNYNVMWHSTKNLPAHLGYKFTNPTSVRKFSLTTASNALHLPTEFTLQGFNGTEWVDIQTYTETPLSETTYYYDVTNENYYMSYRLNFTKSASGEYVIVTEIQFYGRQLEALIPPMTSNTQNGFEVSSNSTDSSTKVYNAFDNNDSTRHVSGSVSSGWIMVKSENPIKPNSIRLLSVHTGTVDIIVKLSYSDDGSVWNDIDVDIANFVNGTNERLVNVDVGAHKYWRVTQSNDKATYFNMYTFQLYGTPDYESRTYIYDNGVELMELEAYKNNDACTALKEADYLHLKVPAATSRVADVHCCEPVNLTPYTYMCCNKGLKIGSGTYPILSVVSTVPLTTNESNVESKAIITLTDDSTTYLDISNTNAEKYISVGLGNNSAAVVKEVSITEWWLE